MSGKANAPRTLPVELDFDNEKMYPENQLLAAYNWEFLRELITQEPEEIIHPFFPYCRRFRNTPYSALTEDLKKTLAEHVTAQNVTYYLPQSFIKTSNIETLPHVWHEDELGGSPGLALLINWNLTTSALKKRFGQIIDAHRAVESVEARGRAKTSAVREKLRFLTAKRVWKAAGGNFKKAYNIWPYSKREGSWRSAVSKADDILSRFRRLKCSLL